MSQTQVNRRRFLQKSSALSGIAIWTGLSGRAHGFANPNDRPRIAAIGTGSRWGRVNGGYGSGKEFPKYGDIVAVCDADSEIRDRASGLIQAWGGEKPDSVADYRKILDRDDIDIVHISTPDHWHAKIAIEAMLAGKDIYCEKPMTLTIEEGQQMSEVCRETGRIVQIGTQQRSSGTFVKAIAMIQQGRIGEIKKVTCSVGGAPTSPQIPAVQSPKNLDWNQWLGPAPEASYRRLAGNKNETKFWSNNHYEFRWWYEYSGGKLTDWGAHHVDIATWGMGKDETGPVSIDPIMVKHPVPFKDGHPTEPDRYNTATEFMIKVMYADGIELNIRHDQGNGILFEGTKGRIFVNRGRLTGKPVEDLATNPLPEDAMQTAYKGRPLTDHFRNFFECVVDRVQPISDIFTHHRALTTCHLAGIAARLGRKIQWDPTAEKIVDDQQAQSFVGREKRKGFEIEMKSKV